LTSITPVAPVQHLPPSKSNRCFVNSSRLRFEAVKRCFHCGDALLHHQIKRRGGAIRQEIGNPNLNRTFRAEFRMSPRMYRSTA
jgi:hypothetical protein